MTASRGERWCPAHLETYSDDFCNFKQDQWDEYSGNCYSGDLLISVMMTADLLKPLANINPIECVGNGETYHDASPKYYNNLLNFVTHTYSGIFEISEYKVKEII